MEHPDSFPTSADYAMDASRNTLERMRVLQARVSVLEDVVSILLKSLGNFGQLCNGELDNLSKDNEVIKNWNRWG